MIGYYEDTGLRYVGHWTGETPEEAVALACGLHEDNQLVIVEVIAGHHNGLLDGEHIWDAEDCNWSERSSS